MSSPLLPTTRLVVAGWLQLAAPGVQVATAVPEASDTLRAAGFLQVVTGVGGGPDRDVPTYRAPITQVSVWWPPALRAEFSHWHRAEQLAEKLVAATDDRALTGVLIDLSTVGAYGAARVHDVTAVSEPDPVEDDPSDWARYDLDLALTWSPIDKEM